MITPQNTKSACFQPSLLNSGRFAHTSPTAKGRTPWHLLSFEPIGREPNCQSLSDHPYRSIGSGRPTTVVRRLGRDIIITRTSHRRQHHRDDEI